MLKFVSQPLRRKTAIRIEDQIAFVLSEIPGCVSDLVTFPAAAVYIVSGSC